MGLIHFFKAKIGAGDVRTLKIKKNIFITFIFKGGSLLVNLLLVPLTINFVSPSEYGVWLTISSIIAWFGISDIGLGHGLRNKFAETVALGNKILARSYVSTAYITLSIVISIVWIIFFFLNIYIDWSVILNTDVSIKDDLSKVVLILFTFFSLQFVLKLVGTVLTANQEPGKAAGFDFIANIFILISIYILMYFNVNGSLKVLALLTGSYQILVLFIASIWFYSHELKEYRPSIKYFNVKLIRSLISLSIKFFIIQISMIFILQSTNIIVAQVVGSDGVTLYNIAYRYFTIPMTILLIIVSPLWSAFTDAHTKKDYVWMRNIYKKLFILSTLITFVLILQYFVSNFAYEIWLNNSVLIPKSISLMMCINIITTTFFSVFAFILNGTGKLYVILIVQVSLSFIYIPVAFLFGKSYGVEGVIFVNILINIIYNVVILTQCHKIVNEKAVGIWGK